MTYKRKHPILGVSRGARMVRQEPTLAALFDENKAVVSKIQLRDTSTIFQKALPELIEKIYHLPVGIGVLE
jgi:predicted choloylglycine hydrolase